MGDFYCDNCQSVCFKSKKKLPCELKNKCEFTGKAPVFLLPENKIVLEIYNHAINISNFEKVEWSEKRGDSDYIVSKYILSIDKLPEIIELYKNRIYFGVETLLELITLRHSIYRNKNIG